MFSTNLSRPGAIALAVLAASGAPAGATDLPAAGDAERDASGAILSRIRADAAHLRGITGRGVVIGVLDTGISAGHREFDAAGKLLPGFSAVSPGGDAADRTGHGSHVAAIAAAARNGKGIYGVAYEARILPVKVFADVGGSTAAVDSGLRHAIGKADIVNLSLASNGAYDPGALREAVRAGLLLVAAAGNDGAFQPGWPARFAREAWAGNQIIAVGAVDGANRIAPFSNRAGDAAAWFLVAPGTGILSASLDGRYAVMNGTSMATPMVSGAAALIKQLWPALRADQVANILFVTATDLGAPGIDPVYGRGLLNVEKALAPVGPLITTTLNGRRINVLAGSVQPSAATSKLWQLAASGQMRVVGLDDFERDFGFDLGATVARPAPLSMEQVMGGMDSRLDVSEQVLGDGLHLAALTEVQARPGAGVKRRLAAFSLTARDAQGGELAFGMGGLAPQAFGAGALLLDQDLALAQVAALANPYFTLAPGATHLALARQVGGLKLRVGMLGSGMDALQGAQDGGPAAPAGLPKAHAGLFEMSKRFGPAALSVSMSQTRESNAWLGAWSSGALAFGPRASTSALQVAGAFMLAPKLALAGQAAYGVTPGAQPLDNLVTEISRARTNAFSFALVAADRVKPGDRVSLSLSQPMRAYAGRIVMDLLSRQVGSGGAARERLVFSMVPLGREMRVQLNYQAPVAYGATLAVTAMVRRDPNNMVGISTEKLLAVRYLKSF
ncbi:MAG TPA: S8 family peptidase [Noviherbaspirillum sp.]|uniref:S8 family peptidase n=1 Tax=Noviherbaspirillum sp. TaxID=1926288 RepID=UPI002D699F3F|nr:S8 family peptidase [Noviherbaspirillum sp.]HYD93793.1 S8 family peptidase [Noviherbaspirillum sp.]